MNALLGHFGIMGSLAGQGIGRLVVTGLIFGTAVATMATAATGALFTDSQSVGANTFSTGTLDISTAPTTAVVSLSGMAPRDSVVNDITVSNGGSLQLRYAVTSTTTEDSLAAQLDATIWDENEESDGGTDCNSTAPGTVLYGPTDLGNTSGVDLVGDPTTGSQAGDRTVAASGSEVLCVLVSLPLSSGNSYQNLTTTATLDFAAEQTKNN